MLLTGFEEQRNVEVEGNNVPSPKQDAGQTVLYSPQYSSGTGIEESSQSAEGEVWLHHSHRSVLAVGENRTFSIAILREASRGCLFGVPLYEWTAAPLLIYVKFVRLRPRYIAQPAG